MTPYSLKAFINSIEAGSSAPITDITFEENHTSDHPYFCSTAFSKNSYKTSMNTGSCDYPSNLIY